MAPEGDGNPDRIAVLERRVKDLEALVKGLTEELLDVKAIAMRLAKVSEERTRADVRVTRTAGQAEEPAATVVLRRGQKTGQEPPAPVKAQEPPAPVPEERVEMIMQPDGTLKPEKRRAEGVIIASAAYAQRAKQRGAPEVKRKSTLIVAEDDDKSETKQ